MIQFVGLVVGQHGLNVMLVFQFAGLVVGNATGAQFLLEHRVYDPARWTSCWSTWFEHHVGDSVC